MNKNLCLKFMNSLLFSFSVISCQSTTPTYYESVLQSNVDGRYVFKIQQSSWYCKGKIDEKSKDIPYSSVSYPIICNENTSKPLYESYSIALAGTEEKAKNMCHSKKIEYLGYQDNKDFTGMTGSSCYTSSNYNISDYSSSININGSDRTYCTSSQPMYSYSTDIYFQCLPSSYRIPASVIADTGESYYFLGLHAKKHGEKQKALERYKEACIRSYILGCAVFALLEQDKGNISEAEKLLNKACDGENMWGCTGLGFLEYNKGNISEAEKLLNKACDGENMWGCTGLGELEYEKGNTSKAKKIYKKACNGGANEACKVLMKLNKK